MHDTVMLVLLFLGLFCYSSHHYSEREEELARMNMAYVAQRRDYMATTYAPRYDPRPLSQDLSQQPPPPPPAATTSHGRRARPSSLTEPFTTYDRENEPTYPATAYPFAGYSVVSAVAIFQRS